MRHIAILGWYGSANAGDEAVLESVRGSLRRRNHTDLVVLSTNPQETAAGHAVKSVSRSLADPAAWRAVWSASALVLGGGGLIQDSSSVYNLPLYAFYVALARLRGVPVVGWGLGVGPLYTNLGRLLARFIFRTSAYFSVRDTASRAALRQAGISPSRVTVSADPAFLTGEVVPAAESVESARQPRIVFCLRHRLHDAPGLNLRYLLPVGIRHRLGLETASGAQDDQRFIASMARGVYLCVEEFGARVILLPFWAERDDRVLREVEQQALRIGVPRESIEWADVRHTPSSLAEYLSRADLLVGMRLHALIFAAVAGVPCLALSYVPKVRALMRLLDAQRWVVEVHTRVPSEAEMEMKLRQLWKVRHEESGRLRTQAARLRRAAEKDAEGIASMLQG